MPSGASEIAERIRIFKAALPYFGMVQPSAFFQRTSAILPNVQRIHNLIEGIYKPGGWVYPLSIASMLKSRYSDQLFHNPDRTWWMEYSPKAGGMDLAVNAGLIRCMADKQPLIVLRQEGDKTSAAGSRHLLLGLGYVERFDPAAELFRIRGLTFDEVAVFTETGLSEESDDLIETALRLESLEDWVPFAAEDRAVYRISRQKRDAAFRSVVLSNYGYTCAVTGQKFRSPRHVEADGAHIIGKEVRGTDDPRNGIALSKSAHWAFDRGIFTISDQYEVVVNPKISSANVANFPAIELDRRKILLPDDPYYRPHPEALAWHKQECFDRFLP
jgi:HNH endonuclease